MTPEVPQPPSGEPGWWIMAKVILFVAIPTFLVVLVKLVVG